MQESVGVNKYLVKAKRPMVIVPTGGFRGGGFPGAQFGFGGPGMGGGGMGGGQAVDLNELLSGLFGGAAGGAGGGGRPAPARPAVPVVTKPIVCRCAKKCTSLHV